MPEPQAFAENDHAQKHGDERKNVIAQRCPQGPAGLNRIDEEEPVGRDHDGGQQHLPDAPRPDKSAQGPKPSLHRQNAREEHEGPQGAMCQHLFRRHMGQSLVIDRGQTPDHAGTRDGRDAFARLAHPCPLLPFRTGGGRGARRGQGRAPRPICQAASRSSLTIFSILSSGWLVRVLSTSPTIRLVTSWCNSSRRAPSTCGEAAMTIFSNSPRCAFL